MTAIDKQSKEYLEFCYKKYTRVAEMMESQKQSATDDFKMLGAIGCMLAWQPIEANLIETHSPQWLLVGFVLILFLALTAIIFNFMKQSVALYYADQMKYYEGEIKLLAGINRPDITNGTKYWTHWIKRIQETLTARFFGLLLSFVLIFPTAMLIMRAPEQLMYAGIYFVIALVSIGLVMQVLNTLTRKITTVLEQD